MIETLGCLTAKAEDQAVVQELNTIFQEFNNEPNREVLSDFKPHHVSTAQMQREFGERTASQHFESEKPSPIAKLSELK